MAPDHWFDDRWERYTSAEFLKRAPDKYEHYCSYARTFHEWTANLVTNATTNPDVISINQAKVQLSDKLELQLYTVEKELTSDKVAAIRFYPDGSSTGGRVTIGKDDRKFEIDVDWLTGRVRINQPET